MCLAVRLLQMRTVYNWSLVFENCAARYQIMTSWTESQEVAQINCDGFCDLWTAPLHASSPENRKRAPRELNKTEKKTDGSAFHTLAFNVASRWWLCSWWNVCVNSFPVWPLAMDLVDINSQIEIAVWLCLSCMRSWWSGEQPLSCLSLLPLCFCLTPIYAAVGTFTSPGKWSRHFCSLCLFPTLSLFAHRRSDMQRTPAPDRHSRFHRHDFCPLISASLRKLRRCPTTHPCAVSPLHHHLFHW